MFTLLDYVVVGSFPYARLVPMAHYFASLAEERDLLEDELEFSTQSARTVGDFVEQVKDRKRGLEKQKGESGMQVEAGRRNVHDKTAELLGERADDIAQATKGFEDMRLADLPDGVMGQNTVGGSTKTAELSRDALFGSKKDLRRVVLHEADPELGHASQAVPEVQKNDAALIVEGTRMSIGAVLEGDVERGTAEEIDGSASKAREGQPEEEYGEGQRGANKVIGLVGERAWNDHVKKSGPEAGKYGKLQGLLWQQQLKASRTSGTAERILREAKETGYTDEAFEALRGAA